MENWLLLTYCVLSFAYAFNIDLPRVIDADVYLTYTLSTLSPLALIGINSFMVEIAKERGEICSIVLLALAVEASVLSITALFVIVAVFISLGVSVQVDPDNRLLDKSSSSAV